VSRPGAKNKMTEVSRILPGPRNKSLIFLEKIKITGKNIDRRARKKFSGYNPQVRVLWIKKEQDERGVRLYYVNHYCHVQHIT
jgi:hypothetical protein